MTLIITLKLDTDRGSGSNMKMWFAGAESYCVKLSNSELLSLKEDLLCVVNKSNVAKELLKAIEKEDFFIGPIKNV